MPTINHTVELKFIKNTPTPGAYVYVQQPAEKREDAIIPALHLPKALFGGQTPPATVKLTLEG